MVESRQMLERQLRALHPNLQAVNRKTGQTWVLKLKAHLLIVSKEFYQLGAKHSNHMRLWGQSRSNHHTLICKLGMKGRLKGLVHYLWGPQRV